MVYESILKHGESLAQLIRLELGKETFDDLVEY